MAAYRSLAAGRPEPAELNLLMQMAAITDDPETALQHLPSRQPQLTENQVLELPVVLAGSREQITEQVRATRERDGTGRDGFTYFTVLEPYMEPFGQVTRRCGRSEPFAG